MRSAAKNNTGGTSIMSSQATKLSVEQLRHQFDSAQLDFKSTEELPAYEGVIGQERALQAISFGINIKSKGYHLYALGPVGTGKKTRKNLCPTIGSMSIISMITILRKRSGCRPVRGVNSGTIWTNWWRN
jgi:hypothetical protein